MAENRVIGRDGRLPWRLPDDLRRFKRLTLGHPVVMGRKTWDTMNGPLVGRRNIVVTRNPHLRIQGADVVHGLDQALQLTRGENEVFIAGGEQIYAAALPIADRLYLTIVHTTTDGDARFPSFPIDEWTLVEEHRHDGDEHHAYPFTFRTFDRRRSTD